MEVAAFPSRKEYTNVSDSPRSTAPTQASSSNDHIAAGSRYMDHDKPPIGNPPRPAPRSLRRRHTLSPPKTGLLLRRTRSRKGGSGVSGDEGVQDEETPASLEKLQALGDPSDVGVFPGAEGATDAVESEEEISSNMGSSKSGGRSSKNSPVTSTIKRLSRVTRMLRNSSGGDVTMTVGRITIPRSEEADDGALSGARHRGDSVDALSRRKIPDEFLAASAAAMTPTARSPDGTSSSPDSPPRPTRVAHKMTRGVTVPASFDRHMADRSRYRGYGEVPDGVSVSGTSEVGRGRGLRALRKRLSRTLGHGSDRSKSPSPSRASRSRSRSPHEREMSTMPQSLGTLTRGDGVKDRSETAPPSVGTDLGQGLFHRVEDERGPSTARAEVSTGAAKETKAGEVKHARGHSWHSGCQETPRKDCFVPAPPSALKYGDRVRLWARPFSEQLSSRLMSPSSPNGAPLEVLLEGSRPVRSQEEGRRGKGLWRGKIGGEGKKGDKAGAATPGSAAVGGYVGSCHLLQRELLRRSEVVVIGKPYEEDGDYSDCHFRAVDPEGKRGPGDSVCFGDMVLLVDDRSMAWSENTHGMSGTLRMRAEGSSRNIAVSFRLPRLAQGPGLIEDGRRPVVFGREGVEIVTEDPDGKATPKRRRSSKKRGLPLSAYRKSGEGVVGGIVCTDGRGSPLIFELHLPNASARGDPSPVVTEEAPSSGSTASPLPAAFGGPLSSKVTVHPVKRLSFDLLQPPPRSPALMSGGESSTSTTSSATVSYSASSEMTRSSSAPRMARPMGDDQPREVEVPNSELDLEVMDGLKWGEYVRFRMAEEHQVDTDHVMVTLRLSNKTLVSISSQQLRDKAGMGEFEVEAREEGLLAKESGAHGQGSAGVVVMSCKLSPIMCPRDGLGYARDEELARGRSKRTVESSIGRLRQLAARSWSRVVSSRRDSGSILADKHPYSGDGFSKSSGSWLVFSLSRLFIATALLMVAGLITGISSRQGSQLGPCTSVWDLRMPDGSAYPRHQLAAAAAAFEEAGALRGAGLRKLSIVDFDADNAAPESRPSGQSVPHGFSGQPEALPPLEPGASSDAEGTRGGSDEGGGDSGRGVDTGDSSGAVGHTAGVPRRDGGGVHGTDEDGSARELVGAAVGEVVSSGLASVGRDRDEASSGQRLGGWRRGSSVQALLPALVGIVAVAVLAIMGLFGYDWGTTSTEGDQSRPLQAQLQFLRWRAGGIAERRGSVDAAGQLAARTASGTESIYVDPPSGSDLPPMPYRFMLAENLDAEKAWQRWRNTVAWRQENGADEVLSKPHPKYSVIKSKYAHCFHLPDKDGRLTYYERPGASEMSELKKLGVTRKDLVEHYMYCMEFLWQVLQPSQTQRITVVIDLEGVRMMDLAGESVSFLRTTVGMLSKHYPQRSFKILILNAPSFFNTIFAMVKPLLNEATKKKIDVLAPSQATVELLKVIPSENLPVEYGGTCQVPLTKSESEASLLAHTQKILEESGVSMAGVA